jgi:hypothetical protein
MTSKTFQGMPLQENSYEMVPSEQANLIRDVVFYLTHVPPSLSLGARVAFIAIGRGMRLVVDCPPTPCHARLVMDPDFCHSTTTTYALKPIPVPVGVAHEMISSGLMKKLDRGNYNGADADWWCMIQ